MIVLFTLQIKSLLEMLVKKCGLDAVKAVMPEEHMKLLTNIRKVLKSFNASNDNLYDLQSNLSVWFVKMQVRERKERRVAANSEESKSHHSKATTSRFVY